MTASLSFVRKISLFLLLLLASHNVLLASSSDEAAVIYKFKDWSVYKGPEDVYFIASRAKEQSGTFSKREDPFLIISIFPDRPSSEVSVYIGYTCKSGAPVNVSVSMSNSDASNVRKFLMQSSGERAWARKNEDENIIDSFKKGAKATIFAESFKNTNSRDVYSLDGFSDAYKALTELKQKH